MRRSSFGYGFARACEESIKHRTSLLLHVAYRIRRFAVDRITETRVCFRNTTFLVRDFACNPRANMLSQGGRDDFLLTMRVC